MADEIDHWHVGVKGDGKIYLNDGGEAYRIDKRGVTYKVGSDGRRIVPTRRPKHLHSPEEWDTMRTKARDKASKKAKRERAKASKKDRKRATVGKKLVDKMLGKMIFPKIVQCDKIDLELGGSRSEGWEWAEELIQQQLQDEYVEDVIPAVPACSVFNEDWIPAMPCTTVPQHRVKNPEHKSCFNAMVTRPVARKEMISNDL